jgi:hypothetical protein
LGGAWGAAGQGEISDIADAPRRPPELTAGPHDR